MYDYIITGKGQSVSIIYRAKGKTHNIAFLQDEEAINLLEQLEKAETDQAEQEILSDYDY